MERGQCRRGRGEEAGRAGESETRVAKAGAEWAGLVSLSPRKGSNGNGQIHFPESILLLEFFNFSSNPHTLSLNQASSQKFKELRATFHHLVLLDVAIMSKKDASP